MSETNQQNTEEEVKTGPYSVSLFMAADEANDRAHFGHLFFVSNPDFNVTYYIDQDETSDTFGHLFVSYGTKL